MKKLGYLDCTKSLDDSLTAILSCTDQQAVSNGGSIDIYQDPNTGVKVVDMPPPPMLPDDTVLVPEPTIDPTIKPTAPAATMVPGSTAPAPMPITTATEQQTETQQPQSSSGNWFKENGMVTLLGAGVLLYVLTKKKR